jgi:hypothetical protein
MVLVACGDVCDILVVVVQIGKKLSLEFALNSEIVRWGGRKGIEV